MNDERDYKPMTIKWIDDEGVVKNKLIDGCQWYSTMEMAEKEANNRSIEIWTRPRDESIDAIMLYSSLSLRRQTQLNDMADLMIKDGASVVDDFVKNPSEGKGEIDFKKKVAYGDGIRIHQNSPQLDDDERKWKSTKDMMGEVDELRTNDG